MMSGGRVSTYRSLSFRVLDIKMTPWITRPTFFRVLQQHLRYPKAYRYAPSCPTIVYLVSFVDFPMTRWLV